MDSTKRVHVDLDLALAGYLTGPDGSSRYIHGLEEIARDAILYGCVLYWDDAPMFHGREVVGLCYCWSGVILLASWLYHAEPFMVRRVMAHEIAHHVVGPSHERVNHWMTATHEAAAAVPEVLTWPA